MTRHRALHAARAVFVLSALACAGWGFHGRGGEIADALAGTGPLRCVAAVGSTVAGLVLTGLLWRLLLARVGSDVTVRDAAAVFFVGQLGKYVPGSVWSLAAQAQLGRRHEVPARSSLAASSLFLLLHTASGLLIGGALVLVGALDPVPDLGARWAYVAVVAGALGMAPPLVRRLADRLAGSGAPTVLGAAEVGRAVVLMAGVWCTYGAALLLLVPRTGPGSPGLAAAVAAFALAHAAGVLVVLAPAGVGAREGVLVALLAPSLGVPVAVALALLSRLTHAVADFVLAGAAATVAGRARGAVPPEPARASGG